MSLMSVALLVAGGLALYFGGDWLVRGASSLARRLDLSSYTIGLTVVALGTSLPEFFISLLAMYKGNPGISIGNIVGSNIANIGLIMGTAALFSPLLIKRSLFKIDFPFLIVVSLLYWITAQDFVLSRIDGALYLGCLALFLFYCFKTRKAPFEEEDNPILSRSIGVDVALIFVGLLGLVFGSDWFVEGSAELARLVGVPELVIGLTVVAFGTSLPELVTSLAAAKHKKTGLVIGNIVGSNLFNICLVQGAVASLMPIPLDTPSLRHGVRVDLPVMVAFAVALLLLGVRNKKVGRRGGAFLFLAYSLYIGMTSLSPS